MKTTLDLLNEAVEMGFDREKALKSIDMALDERFGFENREDIDIAEEQLPNLLYDIMLFSFKCEKENWK